MSTIVIYKEAHRLRTVSHEPIENKIAFDEVSLEENYRFSLLSGRS